MSTLPASLHLADYRADRALRSSAIALEAARRLQEARDEGNALAARHTAEFLARTLRRAQVVYRRDDRPEGHQGRYLVRDIQAAGSPPFPGPVTPVYHAFARP